MIKKPKFEKISDLTWITYHCSPDRVYMLTLCNSFQKRYVSAVISMLSVKEHADVFYLKFVFKDVADEAEFILNVSL